MNKLFVITLLALSFAFLYSLNNPNNTQVLRPHAAPIVSPTRPPDEIFVKRVIDGDTVVLSTGEVVRYIGINTPELSNKNKTVDCFAIEAFTTNKQLVEGKVVRLEKDVSNTDKYRRLLRYVYIDEPSYTPGVYDKEIFVNDYLVKHGYAFSLTYPPDIKYQDKFISSQSEARKNRLGLWKKCIDNETQ